MAMIFQNFDLTLADPEYKLKHKQTLTIKPDNLYMRARLRHGLTPTALEDRISRTGSPRKAAAGAPQRSLAKNVQGDAGMKLTVLYGSNSSTCESMAQQLTSDAPANGFNVIKVCAMDEAVDALPKDDPKHVVVVVTASYEGEPPDNAAKFVSWIKESQNDTSILRGTRYAVFGCGNHNWAQTFHRIPLLVDRCLEELGGKRVAEIGLADAAGDDMFMTFETWEDEVRASLESIVACY
jgi:cytochrome P450 / NADPH-cytochrome P450 reductase